MATYLPEEEWKDAKLMSFMFREFRAKEANPEGWTSKLNFWVKNINKWCAVSGNVEFTISDIRHAFEREASLPEVSTVKLVLSNELRKNEIITLNDFITKCQQSKNTGWISWGLNTTIVKPLSWGFSLLGSGSDPEEEKISDKVTDDTKFININQLQKFSDKLEKHVSSSSQYVYRIDALQNVSKGLNITNRSLDLSLLLLESQKKVNITVDCGVKVIKFGSEFTELELGTLRLEYARELIESEVKRFEKEMETLRDEARMCVKEKNNFRAKQLLKRKKRLEGVILKKETQLDNIDFLLNQLSEADSHQTVLHAYKEGAEMLKSAQKSVDLDSTLFELEDTLQEQSDLLATLAIPIGGTQYDEDELKKELNELLADDEDVSTQEATPAGDEPVKDAEAQQRELAELMSRLEKLRDPNHSIDEKVPGKKKSSRAAARE
ncbi:Charged multivesicular body protein 7 [Halotydeus destructor]|nr:Charged multivesicular body protein 7 [Halotydeus destructor]